MGGASFLIAMETVLATLQSVGGSGGGHFRVDALLVCVLLDEFFEKNIKVCARYMNSPLCHFGNIWESYHETVQKRRLFIDIEDTRETALYEHYIDTSQNEVVKTKMNSEHQ